MSDAVKVLTERLVSRVEVQQRRAELKGTQTARDAAEDVANGIKRTPEELWRQHDGNEQTFLRLVYKSPLERYYDKEAGLVGSNTPECHLVTAQQAVRWLRDRGFDKLANTLTTAGCSCAITEVPGNTKIDDAVAGDGSEGSMGWKQAKDKFDRLRANGEPFTSYEKMADRIGCTKRVAYKAIKEKGTFELQEWAAKQKGESRRSLSPESSSIEIENTPDQREDAPANRIESDDIDAAMNYLIEQAEKGSPDDVNRLREMPADRCRAIAELVYQDPDKADQIERHRRSKG